MNALFVEVVHAEDGTPLAGATVRAFGEADDLGRPHRCTTRTRGDGRALLASPARTAFIEALAPGRTPRGHIVAMHRARPRVRFALAPGRTFAGHAVDAHGNPVAAVTVVALWCDANQGFSFARESLAGTMPVTCTRDDGRFALLAVEERDPRAAGRTLCVAARTRGVASSLGPAWITGLEARAPGEDGVVPFDVVLHPGRSLEGRVVLASGEAAAGATLWCIDRADDQPLGLESPTVATADGRFHLHGLRPGRVLVNVHHPKARHWPLLFDLTSRDETDVLLPLLPA